MTQNIRKEFEEDLHNAITASDVEAVGIKYLGRKGPIQALMQQLKDCAPEDRPRVGRDINDLKVAVTAAVEAKKLELAANEEEAALANEALDITLPGARPRKGSQHLVTKVQDRVIDILASMGFSVQYGPDIDTDYYNFEALNFAPHHPAKDMQDTFYIDNTVLLRTHTSNIQVRFMEKEKPPMRIIAPGKCFRNEAISARSHVFFHQVEALYIDKGVTFADLLATMRKFFKELLGDVEFRFRPSYFPFVEPGIEVDVSCIICKGEGCGICKESGWLEVAGAGMVHPEVLKNGGIDPEEYSGYAWGLGIERLVMLLHGVTDIRTFTENDVRFLNQF